MEAERPRRWGLFVSLLVVAVLAGLVFSYKDNIQRLAQAGLGFNIKSDFQPPAQMQQPEPATVAPVTEVWDAAAENGEFMASELSTMVDETSLDMMSDTPGISATSDTPAQGTPETGQSLHGSRPTTAAVVAVAKLEPAAPPLNIVEKKAPAPAPVLTPVVPPKPVLAKKVVVEPPREVQKPPIKPDVPPAILPVAPPAPPVIEKTEVTPLQTKVAPEIDVPSQMTIPEFELVDLVYSLVAYYEAGDLERLVSLFSANAEADGAKGLTRIRKDYAALFETTDMRQLRIGELRWQQDKDMVAGSGNFSVSVWRKNGGKPVVQSGVLRIDVVRKSGELLITKLSHVVN